MEEQQLIRLVNEAKAGSSDAVTQLVKAYHPTIKAMVKKQVGDHIDYRPIETHAFSDAFTHLNTLKDPRDFESWMEGYVKQEALRYAKPAGKLIDEALKDLGDDNLSVPGFHQEAAPEPEPQPAVAEREVPSSGKEIDAGQFTQMFGTEPAAETKDEAVKTEPAFTSSANTAEIEQPKAEVRKLRLSTPGIEPASDEEEDEEEEEPKKRGFFHFGKRNDEDEDDEDEEEEEERPVKKKRRIVEEEDDDEDDDEEEEETKKHGFFHFGKHDDEDEDDEDEEEEEKRPVKKRKAAEEEDDDEDDDEEEEETKKHGFFHFGKHDDEDEDDEDEEEEEERPVKKKRRVVEEEDDDDEDDDDYDEDDKGTSWPLVVLIVILGIIVLFLVLFIFAPSAYNKIAVPMNKILPVDLPLSAEANATAEPEATATPVVTATPEATATPEETAEATAEASAEATAAPENTVQPGQADAQGQMGTLVVNVSDLRIRTKAGTDGDVVGQAVSGKEYPVYDHVENGGYTWYLIGTNQWVASNGSWVTYTGN